MGEGQNEHGAPEEEGLDEVREVEVVEEVCDVDPEWGVGEGQVDLRCRSMNRTNQLETEFCKKELKGKRRISCETIVSSEWSMEVVGDSLHGDA
jgi:hypothetical protein